MGLVLDFLDNLKWQIESRLITFEFIRFRFILARDKMELLILLQVEHKEILCREISFEASIRSILKQKVDFWLTSFLLSAFSLYLHFTRIMKYLLGRFLGEG
jgi:hypothetical protein